MHTQKVAERQKLILLTTLRLLELEAMEYQYLLDLQKAETGCRCRLQNGRKNWIDWETSTYKNPTANSIWKYEALDKDKIPNYLRLTE